MRRSTWLRIVLLLALVMPLNVQTAGLAQTGDSPGTSAREGKSLIEIGFDLLYRLKFSAARELFGDWRRLHPNDPLGDACTAAAYLFEEFYCQGVLTSEYFLDDGRLLGGTASTPDREREAAFEAAAQRARQLAQRQLDIRPDDANSLFALTMVSGMQADALSILEKRQWESLRLIKEANHYAQRLLAHNPDRADAWLALGAANYIVGCLPAYKRLFAWLGGLHGDKRKGMEQLRRTAEQGHYLKPLAQIFLALAAMREGLKDVARRQFAILVDEYPDNPLYLEELARLNGER